jgi:flagellum-specific ATP synthase
VEGDDLNEPISDTVRGILDGHIVLTRALATSNHYPAIDVLESVSRVMKDIVPAEHYDQAGYIKNIMSVYRKARDLIDIGAYKSGSNAEIDEAIRINPHILRFLRQSVDEPATYDETIGLLHKIGK